MITLDPTISFSLGAIVGALATKIIDHFLAKSRTTEDRIIKDFNSAAERFREPIYTALQHVQAGKCHVTPILKSSFNEQTAAIMRFLPFVIESERDAFNKTWSDYKQFYNEVFDPVILAVGGHYDTLENIQNLSRLKAHLICLLYYASPK